MLYFPPCICVSMQISMYFPQQVGKWQTDMRSVTQNARGSPKAALRSTRPGSTKDGQIRHKLPMASSGNKQLESGAFTETPSAIWDTLGYLRGADVAQQQQLDAKNDVLIHLKEPSLGNQELPWVNRSFENLCTQSPWGFIFNLLAETKDPPYS